MNNAGSAYEAVILLIIAHHRFSGGPLLYLVLYLVLYTTALFAVQHNGSPVSLARLRAALFCFCGSLVG